MSTTSRTKRKGEDLTRIALTLLSSLNKVNATITLSSIMDKFSLTKDEAKRVLDIIIKTSSQEDMHLPLVFSEDEESVTLCFDGVKGQPLRLTRLETTALIAALDAAGLPQDALLYQKLRNVFVADDDAQTEIMRLMPQGTTSDLTSVLMQCIAAYTNKKRITCLYEGINDTEARVRTLDIVDYYHENTNWYIKAYDVDDAQGADMVKTFKVSRISNVQLAGESSHTDFVASEKGFLQEDRRVTLVFTDTSYLSGFNWPGLEILEKTDSKVVGRIPYTGSMWLPQMIDACSLGVTTDDEEVNQKAKIWAQHLLDEAQ